jgi:hypothetical protein
MPDKPKTERKPEDPAQSKRFVEAAREAKADESEERADRAFKALARSKKLPAGPRSCAPNDVVFIGAGRASQPAPRLGFCLLVRAQHRYKKQAAS